ncbi:DUF222 domain-containing protein [Arthrobacter globiformis]|uniref:HNH endonuclease signature motif containing protein n=1 Tax=Arthrobacter globiformis TaxID=1665 RepID=UPI003978E80F
MAVSDDGVWVPAVDFADREDSLLAGTLSVPLPSFLTADQALGVVESADRVIAWATAMKMSALARVEEAMGEESPPRHESQPVRFGGDEAHALAVSEVGAACALSEGTAARWLNDAADLATSHWQVLEAVEQGEISEAHARIILDQARSLPATQAEQFATIALQRTRTRHGRRRTPSEFRSCLRRLRERLHPESLTTRKEAAQRERGVWFTAEPDGMCTLTARLTAETGLAIYSGLDQHARQAHAHATKPGPVPGADAAPDHNTLPELRADAFTHRFLGENHGPETGAFRAEIIVTIPVRHILSNEPETAEPETAELEGYGPIDAATARRLAALAPTWQRLFTDCTTGQTLGVGRTAYRPPKALRRYLNSRDKTCRFPGCPRPATACEPDHTIEWQNGGTTDPGNLAMLCHKHHAIKSIGAWTYTQSTPTGNLQWRSPLGRKYNTKPADFGNDLYPPKAPEPPPF